MRVRAGPDTLDSSVRSHVLLPMREPPIRRLVLGGAISAYGDALQNAAQAWAVVQQTHSARAFGLFAMAWLLPRVGSTLLAGVLVDVRRRSSVLKTATWGGTAVAALFFACTLAGALSFHVVLLLAFCSALIGPFEVNARNTLLPTLSTRDKIPAIVGLNFFVMYSAELLGLVTSGLVLAWVGVIGCVALNLASFVIYLVLMQPIHSPPFVRAAAPLGRSFVEGLRFVVTKRKAALPLLVGSVFALVGFHFDRSTLPLFAVEHLHASARTYGLLLAASPLGAVLLLGISRARLVQQLPSRIIATSIVLGIGLALLSLTTLPSVAFPLLLVTGAARGIHYNAIATLLQLKVPDALRGRLFSFYNLAGGLFGLGGMIMNGLAPTVGRWVSGHAGALEGLPDPHGLRGAILLAAAATTLCALAFLPALRRLAAVNYLESQQLTGLPERRETPSIPRL
jgi:MFS family permease